MKAYVICFDRSSYRRFLHDWEFEPEDVTYIRDITHLKGLRNAIIYLYDSFTMREDWYDLFKECRLRELNLIFLEDWSFEIRAKLYLQKF